MKSVLMEVINMSDEKEVKGKFRYVKDSMRYHRFQIETEDAGVVGLVYIPKIMHPLPDKIILERKRD